MRKRKQTINIMMTITMIIIIMKIKKHAYYQAPVDDIA